MSNEAGSSTGTVRVLYPRGVETGGPEALHQLVAALRARGVPAFLVPDPATAHRPRVAAYSTYDAPELADGIPDLPGEVVIAPDVYVRNLLGLRRSRGVCWWLSIDNSPLFRAERRILDTLQGVGEPASLTDVKSLLLLGQRTLTRWRSRLWGVEHLAQSVYARTYLERRLGVRASMLSDYIPGASSAHAREPSHGTQTTRIAFNPAKGARLIAKVQAAACELPITWDGISGLSRAEVIEHLGDAHVYLDLGAHPGKDRMPREAALAGAVTIVASRGSGGFDEDVPLPAAHKVPLNGCVVENAVAVLNSVLSDPESAFAMQSSYRAHLSMQESIFLGEVDDMVRRLGRVARGTGPVRE